MTAEIAVMNKVGIALAADSAVTIAGKKVYNSANKLFTLSKYHPVGILVYGSAEFNEIPWEVIIKEYRNYLKDKEFDTLEEYCTHFQNFLGSPRWKLTPKNQTNNIIRLLNEFCSSFFLEYVRQSEKKYILRFENKVFDSTVHSIKELLSPHKQDIEYDLTFCDIDDNIKKIFESERIEITHSQIETLVDLFKFALASDYPIFRLTSGVVIAGYGKDEIYPTLTTFETAGFIGKQLHMIQKNSTSISDENNASVTPFAQQEMSCLFMEGLHPDLKKFILAQVFQLMDNTKQELINKLKPADKGLAIQTKFQEITKKFLNNISLFSRQNFAVPRLNSIANLSKMELAKIAESLVELQALGKQVSMEMDSVGGPIDVAVISKHDGFIWIKRKLYFNSELNPCFLEKYMK